MGKSSCKKPNEESFFPSYGFLDRSKSWLDPKEARVIAGYKDDALVFWLLCQISRSFKGRVLTILHVPTSDHNESLIDKDIAEETLNEFANYISEGFCPHLIAANSVTESFADWLTDLEVSSVQSSPNEIRIGSFLELQESSDEFLSGYSSRFQAKLGKSRKSRLPRYTVQNH